MSNQIKQITQMIWASMSAIYGHAWTAAHGITDAGDVWAKGLSGFSLDEIKNGLALMMQCDRFVNYPPNLIQFRNLCYNLPDQSEMIKQAIHAGATDDEFVRAMRFEIGSWNIANLPYERLMPMARDAYKIVSQNYMQQIKREKDKPNIQRIKHETEPAKLLR